MITSDNISQGKKLTDEERKKNREKYILQKKENETVYKHYGELTGCDFKIRDNKDSTIYVLDNTKGMFIDKCENCKIITGPIEGSVFIRGCKNCKVSTIANQVRFRDSENITCFTYCPTDPIVESSFNIYFAPYNAFFPNLKKMFVDAHFDKNADNHINSVYDFTKDKEMGGGAPHHLMLEEKDFDIEIIRDGDGKIEEMFDGYVEQEEWIRQRKGELSVIGAGRGGVEEVSNENNSETRDLNNNNYFNNINYNNQNNMASESNNFDFFDINQNQENNNNEEQSQSNTYFNLDSDLNSKMMQTSLEAQTTSNNNAGVFDFTSDEPLGKIDLASGFNQPSSIQPPQTTDVFSNTQFFSSGPVVDEAELQRQNARQQEAAERMKKIEAKREREMELRNETRAKAAEFMTKFMGERKQKIAENHQRLVEQEKERDILKQKEKSGEAKVNLWEKVSSEIDIKEGDYKGSKNVDRMKEIIMNKKNDTHEVPETKTGFPFFG